MLKLKDLLLKEVGETKNSTIASLDDDREWNLPNVEYLMDMNFERDGDSLFVLKNPPVKVYKIKRGAYVIEEPIENYEYKEFEIGTTAPIQPMGLDAFKKSKQIKKQVCKSFGEVIEFFNKWKGQKI